MNKLVKLEDVQFIQNESDIYISGIEICKELGYKNPTDQAAKIWYKHSDILKKYSVTSKLEATDGKAYNTRCYNERGMYFFVTKCNIKKADEITEKLIDCFVTLKNQFKDTKKVRTDGKKVRYELMEAIHDYYPSSNNWIYKNFTDLAYYMVFGKNTKQLRQDYGLSKNTNFRNYLNKNDLLKVSIVEKYIEALVMNRLKYAEIKEKLKEILKIHNLNQLEGVSNE